MSGTFRFIHTADLHLGSFLNINGQPREEIQDLCKDAVYNAFERVCKVAVLYKVDFVLICGDVYDSYLRSVKGNRFFVNQCLTLNERNISVYVIYGNHDATDEKRELFDMPRNVHILSSDNVETFQVYKAGELIARIIGKSYKSRKEREKIYENYLLDNDVFNIGMLHTAMEGDNKNYIPCTLDGLIKVPNIDYWALGHIHRTNILSGAKPIVAFPGIPQGRDMGELGQGGIFLVEVRKKEIVSMEILPISTIIYKRLEIEINEDNKTENFSDLMVVILEKTRELIYNTPEISIGFVNSMDDLSHVFKGHIVQLIIKGRTELQDKITHMREDDYKQFIDDINEELSSEKYFIWVDSIIFRTTSIMRDFESLKVQNSIFRDLEEVINLYRLEGESKVQLQKNWGSIWKQQIYTENIDEDKFDYDEEITEDIILQARQIVIEKLVEALEIV
ncbi:DNA repair exonuclease [Clostridium bowmanii]|uniref:metallophosphoesterase family protein n=1 Tax=Clostridium bowmanii TaxID=132925 RepID=UPI001C0E7DC5|nr:DNA repair exonuclease [Clostridium bowmanii]MBU3189467.1 DNA repair exonuclease [Clostridium bowmanii]MCA1074082.1 DNA repair exonuclease [Clostridium bowmanii]